MNNDGIDALYFRVSSIRQTTENQFDELLEIAERDGSARDWGKVRELLAQVIVEENRVNWRKRTVTRYSVNKDVAEELISHLVYVEQGRSGKKGSNRPVFERMKDAAYRRKFSRILVWKVSRLGRDMQEVISTVTALSEAGVTVLPVRSQTGPITSMMGKLLWAIQAWYAEMENDERSQAVRAGMVRAREAGATLGRPKVVDVSTVASLRAQGRSWGQIAREMGIPSSSARMAFVRHSNGGAKKVSSVDGAK